MARSVAAVLLIAMVMVGPVFGQQIYPGKPIRFIVPYPPGGATTVVARLFGEKLTESWGQAVIVDNRGGANTIIGTEALVKSPPDGYAIMLVANTHVINSLLIATLPYDSIRDFAPIATLASTEQLLVLHPSVPANTLRELIALAKSRPGQLNYATVGSGGPNHLATELFNTMAGIKTQQVPYKGGGPAVIDLIAGQVQLSFNVTSNFTQHVQSGKLKAIAISGEKRFSGLPNVPTFSEAGLPGIEAKGWYGVLAPAGIPGAIVEKLSTEIARIQDKADIREKLASQGLEPFTSTPGQFADLMKADTARYAKIIKAANIKMEN